MKEVSLKGFRINDCNSVAFGKRQEDGDNKEIRSLVRREGKESGGEEKEELLRGGKGNGRVEGRGMRKKRFPHAVSLWGKRSLRESA